MPNKSLEDHIFSRALPPIPWIRRLKILLGAAEGIAYLHEGLEIEGTGLTYSLEAARKIAKLADNCLRKNSDDRPAMSRIVDVLREAIRESKNENNSQFGSRLPGPSVRGMVIGTINFFIIPADTQYTEVTLAAVRGYRGRFVGRRGPEITRNDNMRARGNYEAHKPIVFVMGAGQAIVAAVTSGNKRFFLGTDSAPHDRLKKECACENACK
ncbi:probable serine/threonine-protein kinase PBL19 [Tanacetum coccineum]